MIVNFFKSIFGSRNDRIINQYSNTLYEINKLENELINLSDTDLKNKCSNLRELIRKNQISKNDLRILAFAICREASKRVLSMRHYDEQIIGGLALSDGKISEMKTGEGKTLVATLPAFYFALFAKGVHVVTVNDYLAKRDSEWMGKIYSFLGLKTAINISGLSHDEKKKAYDADILYGTNNEFGFDYLRDNLILDKNERVQKSLSFAIIDEVDSILIDEARTPLIISGQAKESEKLFISINLLAKELIKENKKNNLYDLDEKTNNINFNENGFEFLELLLKENKIIENDESLYEAKNIKLIHNFYSALKAHHFFHLDQHYVIQDKEVIIVDEFTGRLMPGRRWSDGIHQAIEAKENIKIKKENITLASITFQNYFRQYEKICGMTGTADTEAFEFQFIYKLETVIIPTHKKMIRKDHVDKVYKTAKEKLKAIINEIKNCNSKGQPVLVGTTSIESSEQISKILLKEKIKHQILNAKFHEKEAQIIAQAGSLGMVTIATNMAGRGTDIVLGGNLDTDNEEQKKNHNYVIEKGGLHIIGTERHESRRIDNQLRGRSGRQGDPGSSRFFLSLEDPLLRIFASDKVANIMDKLKMPENEAIEHPWVSKAIENSQKKVEGRNFEIRKQLLEFDDVYNDQRLVIYDRRNQILEIDNPYKLLQELITDTLDLEIQTLFLKTETITKENIEKFYEKLFKSYGIEIEIEKIYISNLHQKDFKDKFAKVLKQEVMNLLEKKFSSFLENAEALKFIKSVMLQISDENWREHLNSLDHLRQGIHLRGYAQKNPKQEFKREAFELFERLIDTIKLSITEFFLKVEIKENKINSVAENNYTQNDFQTSSNKSHQTNTNSTFVRDNKKIGRNDQCHCGSGKKYKHCHGKI